MPLVDVIPVFEFLLFGFFIESFFALNGENPLVPSLNPLGCSILYPENSPPIITGCCPLSPSIKKPTTVSPPLLLKLAPVPPSPHPN